MKYLFIIAAAVLLTACAGSTLVAPDGTCYVIQPDGTRGPQKEC